MSVLVNIDIYYAQHILKGRNLQKINIFTYFYPHTPRSLPSPHGSFLVCQVGRGEGGRWVIQSHDIKAVAQKQGVHPFFLVQPSHTTIFCAFLVRASRFSSCILAMVNQGLMAAGLSRAITAGPGLIWR